MLFNLIQPLDLGNSSKGFASKTYNSLYKMVAGFSLVVMNTSVTSLSVALFLLLAFSCSTESPRPESSETNEPGEISKPKVAEVMASDTSSFPLAEPGGFPVVESNYTGEPLSASSVVSIDHRTWEEVIQYNEENRAFDSRTGNLLQGRVKVYGEEGHLSGEYNYMDGLAHGSSKDYYPNGIVSLSVTYLHGKKNGKEEWFTEDGATTYEANFKDDVMDGPEITWGVEGGATEIIYSNGKVVEENPPVEELLEDVGLDLDPVEEVSEEEKSDPDF